MKSGITLDEYKVEFFKKSLLENGFTDLAVHSEVLQSSEPHKKPLTIFLMTVVHPDDQLNKLHRLLTHLEKEVKSNRQPIKPRL